jgi:hypothetical protein
LKCIIRYDLEVETLLILKCTVWYDLEVKHCWYWSVLFGMIWKLKHFWYLSVLVWYDLEVETLLILKCAVWYDLEVIHKYCFLACLPYTERSPCCVCLCVSLYIPTFQVSWKFVNLPIDKFSWNLILAFCHWRKPHAMHINFPQLVTTQMHMCKLLRWEQY